MWCDVQRIVATVLRERSLTLRNEDWLAETTFPGVESGLGWMLRREGKERGRRVRIEDERIWEVRIERARGVSNEWGGNALGLC